MSAAEKIEAAPAAPLDYSEPCLLPRAWRDQVEAWTRNHRAKRAAQHMTECFSAETWSTSVWHAQRAKGQTRRFFKLANCGETFEAVGDCGACGGETRRPIRCGLVNLCPVCRGREARRLRTKVRDTMNALPDEYHALARRKVQPWSWKLLTLTVPHGRGVGADTYNLRTKLWPRFWRTMTAHVRRDCGETMRPLYVRALEVARTGTDDGHAHYHVAVFAPFIHKSYVNLLWGRALSAAGYSCPRVDLDEVFAGTAKGAGPIHPYFRERVQSYFVTRRGTAGRALSGDIDFPVTDLRQAHGDVSHELVKYLIKDIEKGKRLPPRVFAGIYKAVDGTRKLTTSRAFKARTREPMPCPLCDQASCRPLPHGHVGPIQGVVWETINLGEPDTPPRAPNMDVRDEVREQIHADALAAWKEKLRTAGRQQEFTVNP